MAQKLIAQGAEAKIILSNKFIIKDRLSKSYRIKELDTKIRKQRTKKEAKLLNKVSSIINCPIPLSAHSLGKGEEHQIKMPFIDGKKLSDHLNKFSLNKQKQILKQIGQDVAKLHDTQIIHGDLTTSNMILVEKLPACSRSQINKNPNKKQKKQLPPSLSLNKSSAKKSGEDDFVVTNRASAPIIYFIDFGLGFTSHKIEDKAVDIHLLRQALEAKHFQHWKILFKSFIKGYSKSKDAKKTLERLKAVKKRGRYKH